MADLGLPCASARPRLAHRPRPRAWPGLAWRAAPTAALAVAGSTLGEGMARWREGARGAPP
jgi:hypothetical protein